MKQAPIFIRRTFAQSGITNPRNLVGSGEEAISYLAGTGSYSDRQRFPLPGLVLLDLKLPGIDGFEVLKWIRANSALQDLRVVVLTSCSGIREVHKAYQLGANTFLVKPLDFENIATLFATIRTQLWKSHNSQASKPLGAGSPDASSEFCGVVPGMSVESHS
jgi:DNA-binding response OmpR family regulator